MALRVTPQPVKKGWGPGSNPNIAHSLAIWNLSKDFLVVQRLRIYSPTQGTQIRSLVREVPTCSRVTESVSHNC